MNTAKAPFEFPRELDDPLDDLLNAPVRAEPVQPPASYQPKDFSEPCAKCRGTGAWRPGFSCFACKGRGKRTFKTSPEQRRDARAAKARAKARTKAEQLEDFKRDHPDVWAWMDGSEYPFAMSLRGALDQWGSLTDKQLAAARGAIAKRDAGKVAAQERVEQAKAVDVTQIEEAFQRAGAVLQFPKLRVAGLKIYPAGAASKWAGSLYVRGLADDKSEEVYLGRITAGRFVRSRDCTPELEAKVLETAERPREAAQKYGHLTGQCAICSRRLDNAESVARGIGPICAEKFGW